jgi:hypothetical protein
VDAVTASKLMSEHGLVPSKVSQDLLLRVAAGRWDSVEPELDRALRAVRTRYEEIVDTLPGYPQLSPRNLPFYIMVREKYPQFRWEMVQDARGRTRVRFENVPTLQKVNPSLLSLLLERVPATTRHEDPFYVETSVLPLELAATLRATLDHMVVARPSALELRAIVAWIRAGLEGEPLTVFSPICPDYAYEETGDPKVPYRVTFEGLGSGLGIVAKRALRALPLFVTALRRHGLEVRCIVGGGDFEAFSTENLHRLALTEGEFLQRLKASAQAFRAACPFEVEQPMITELCGGRVGWEALIRDASARLSAGDFGAADLDEPELARILAARKKLYQAWFGSKESDSAYRGVLLAQGAEYAAMGRIVSERYARPLVLGADHPAMRPFYGVHQRVPVLYLRQVY